MNFRIWKKRKTAQQKAIESNAKMGIPSKEANRWRNFLRKKTKKLAEK